MRRMLVALLGAGLVLAPAAAAKGPHAVLTSGPEAVMPGVPWEATVELNEFRGAPRPLLIAMHRPRGHVDAKVRRVPASIEGALGFKTTMVFPTAGRWKLMLIAGRRRFNLPALSVGTGEPPRDWVAFPVGSEMARQGAGGELVTGEQQLDPAAADSLPPEATGTAGAESGDDGGAGPVWLLPLAGVVLAGVGAAAFSRRGSR